MLVAYRLLVQVGIGDDDMRVFDLVDHVLADIGDDNFPARGWICDSLLGALELFLWQFVLCCGRTRFLGSLFVDSFVASPLVPIQVFDELFDSGDGVVPRVVATRGMLLLLLLVL